MLIQVAYPTFDLQPKAQLLLFACTVHSGPVFDVLTFGTRELYRVIHQECTQQFRIGDVRLI